MDAPHRVIWRVVYKYDAAARGRPAQLDCATEAEARSNAQTFKTAKFTPAQFVAVQRIEEWTL